MVLSGQMRLDDYVIDGYDESQYRAAVRYTWEVSGQKWLLSSHFHLVAFSQRSRTHILELANSTIFLLTATQTYS